MGPTYLIPGPFSHLGTRLFLEGSFKPQPCVSLLRPLAGSQVCLRYQLTPGCSLPCAPNPDWVRWAP